ncbi:hypothetical protein LCGC14_0862530 [marine sediment metagenome]|uniref:Uncharacterized protein n=1 Tax=marine sediment metagenome TaxID=412755 RepID=A0A0F9PC06_9ZZZZ
MSKTNSWYVLAKQDKRYKYDFYPILHRSSVFYNLDEAKKVKEEKQKSYKRTLVILKRTCQPLEI